MIESLKQRANALRKQFPAATATIADIVEMAICEINDGGSVENEVELANRDLDGIEKAGKALAAKAVDDEVKIDDGYAQDAAAANREFNRICGKGQS